MATWQFVADMATATPSVLLDLNTTGIRVGNDWNLDPAPYDKARVGGPMRHGQRITRSVAGNRVLTIPIEITQASSDDAATAVESLGRQLAVDNILKVQFGSNPVFFRTFADPGYAARVRGILTQDTSLTLEIEAEPFAYGPRVTVTGSPFTVSNNPAAGTNPCRFDVTGVLGDVPTPLLLVATSTGASGTPSGLVSKWTHIATRRRGTPSGYSNVIQAEDMTQGTDTTVTADATMSSGSKSRISYATATGSVLRLSGTFPGGGATIEARGEYTVYARLARTGTGGTIHVQLGYGASSAAPIMNDAVTPPFVTNPVWVNLGRVPVPVFSDPVTHGFSGVQTKASLGFVGIYADRVSSTSNLDIDCLYFVPADDSTVIVKWPSTDTIYAVDGTTDEGGAVYATTAALDEIVSTNTPPQVVGGGGFPEVIPGQTNRIHFLRNVDPNGTADAIGDTTTLAAYYWPRWREFTRT